MKKINKLFKCTLCKTKRKSPYCELAPNCITWLKINTNMPVPPLGPGWGESEELERKEEFE